MKITKLEYQKKDPNRVNIYIDGKFTVGLDVNDVVKLGLYTGQEVPPEQLNKIISESEFGKLFNAALNFLSFRPRSEWEVREFLLRKQKRSKYKYSDRTEINSVKQSAGISDTPALRVLSESHPDKAKMMQLVIDKLRTIGQINDENFTLWFVDQRRQFRQKANRAIKYELLKKGVDRKIIDKILNDEPDQENTISQENLAVKALEKKFKKKNFNAEETANIKMKMQRFLAGRGFAWEEIKSAVEKFFKTEYNEAS